MIALPVDAGALPPLARYGLDVLVDLSRLLPAPEHAGAVRLRVHDGGSGVTPAATDLAGWMARDWTLRPGEGELSVHADALAVLGAVAGMADEQRSTARDRFDRVPSSENRLVRTSLERQAVVSRTARSLRELVVRAAGRRRVLVAVPWPDGRRWAAAFTHDLDAVAAWPVFTALRLLELARKGELATGARAAGAALAAVGRAPLRRAAREVLAEERRHRIRGTWFVICGTPTLRTMRRGDVTYTPESTAARRILELVAADGHEIGLHGSFDTADADDLFTAQRQRLEHVTRDTVAGVRQHYLRMRLGPTHRAMEAAGFAYDSTGGFADRNGFRHGVADVLPTWDDAAGRALALDEVPFVWMDRALSKYRGVEDPAAWVDDALELAAECRAVEGLWTGIWHPNLAPALGYPGAPAAYARLTREVVAGAPYVAPLRELVAWRAARRSLRVAEAAPDGGALRVAAADGAGVPLTLEDADGRPVTEIAWC